MTGAELAARITAARAISADFRREGLSYVLDGGPEPDWANWAYRLQAELEAALAELLADRPEAGKLAEVRAVLAAFDWERDDRQYALEHIERIVLGDDQ
jgi:hypothetical protein